MLKKQNDEVRLLKQVVQRLCVKLKDYQKQFNSNKSLLATEQAQVDSIVNRPLLADDNENGEGEYDPAEVGNDGFA